MIAEPVKILQKVWGYSSFRPLQEEIILDVLRKKDVLALLPTGGGKSVCFQVPALAMDGICIVISPLIALMKDQVEQLKQRGISAIAIYSGMTKREIDIALDNCVYGNVKFLYVSPERLKTELMRERVKNMKVCLLAVDEAHCISQWGYDFRPSYLEIAEFRKQLPGINCIALTATATKEVAEDIQEKLQFTASKVLHKKSFERPNLSYNVRFEENKLEKLKEVLNRVKGTAVVYVRSRKRAQQTAADLWRNGISADYYHAGLSNEARNQRQESWIKNQTRVIVATNAFGMGIDKPDVRVVVHLDLPDTLEAYYQEAGRAGRDEKKAYGVVLYQQKDVDDLRQRILEQFPAVEDIRKTYQALANYYKIAVGSSEMASFDFDIDHFCQTYNLQHITTFYTLRKLEEEGFIQLNESFHHPSKVNILISSQELYAFQIANVGLEPVIKALLRLYGGDLFSGFTVVSETSIAKQINSTARQVKNHLEMMQKMDVIAYDPQKDKPQLTFLTHRYDASKLPIQIKRLEARKKLCIEKAEAVIHYIENINRCRTQMLLDYFNEKDYDECGVCDTCIQKKQGNELDDGLLFKMRQKIITALSLQSLSVQELNKKIANNQQQEHLFAQVVREMLDEGTVAYDNVGCLNLK